MRPVRLLQHILWLLVLLAVLVGCGTADEKARSIAGLMNDCKGTVELTIEYSSWDALVRATCTWDKRDEKEAMK